MVEDLSKIANGTVYGKRRIEFEQFVQASYFDMVIIEANKRLLKIIPYGQKYEELCEAVL